MVNPNMASKCHKQKEKTVTIKIIQQLIQNAHNQAKQRIVNYIHIILPPPISSLIFDSTMTISFIKHKLCNFTGQMNTDNPLLTRR